MDDTPIKLKGDLKDFYRALDKQGFRVR